MTEQEPKPDIDQSKVQKPNDGHPKKDEIKEPPVRKGDTSSGGPEKPADQ